jgi:hypothetical protein
LQYNEFLWTLSTPFWPMHQYLHQDCSVGPRSVPGWFYIGFISLFLATVSYLTINGYS